MKDRAKLSVYNDYIIKSFRYQKDFSNELLIYSFHIDMVPELIETGFKKLYIQRIEDQSIFTNPLTSIPKAIKSLCNFHTALQARNSDLIHFDTNPKNYLFTEEKVYLIDFSEMAVGRKESDIISFFLYWCLILNSSEFETVLLSSTVYLNNYHFIESDFIKEFERFNDRRIEYNDGEGLLRNDNPAYLFLKKILLNK